MKLFQKLSTASITNITEISAKSGGVINNDGGSNITVSGVCWSTEVDPTIENNKTVDAIVSGNFESDVTNLYGGTKYNLRAYAINSTGTGYGSIISFTTKGDPSGAPLTTTLSPSDSTGTLLN